MKGFLSVVGIGVVAYLGYVISIGMNRPSGAGLTLKGPESIAYGAPFEVVVSVSNSSEVVWKGASVSLVLPYGFVFSGASSGAGFSSKQLGDVGVGSQVEIPFSVMAVAEAFDNGVASSTEEVVNMAPRGVGFQAKLSYTQSGSSAVFEKVAEWAPPKPLSAFEVSIEAPLRVASGEEFELRVTYANKTEGDVEGLVISALYPDSFVFVSASADPDIGNAAWQVGGLKKGSADTLLIKGRLKEAGVVQFGISAARESGSVRYPIAAASASIEAEAPPISLAMDVNDMPDYVAHLGDALAYTLSYTMDGIKNPKGGITITADLLSPFFDLATLVPGDGGVFGRSPSGAPRVSWHIAKPDSEGGSVGFLIKAKSDYGIRRLGDRNFTLKVHGEVALGSALGSLDYETKIIGKTDIVASARFRDAASGIVNKGVLPPRVGALTEYIVRWKLVNYATDVRGVIVRAKLPSGVSFAGEAKSNVASVPVYDSAAREVVWRVDRIAATTGLLGTAPEAMFQIASVPEVGMKGSVAPLLEVTDLSATDDFTSAAIHASSPVLTTALPDDPTAAGQGIVQ